MKKCIPIVCSLLLSLGALQLAPAQEATDKDPMWETIILSPDNTKLKILGENLRKHNQKYHQGGPYDASVYNIVSGPDTGKMVWIMGPLQFPQLDNRPSAGGHDEDWRDNVMPYLKKVEQGEYWRGDGKLSNTSMLPQNPAEYPILFTRYWEINIAHQHQVEARLKLISETVKAMEGVNPWGVYYNLFRQGKLGRHIATVGFYKNWTDFDRDPQFKATFLKSHDEDAWDSFIRDTDLLLDDSWDEIWEYNKNLSGD